MDDQQLLRYSRHILLDEIGIEGQQRLLASKALVVGAGGLGCPAAMFLASAGVGSITLVDDDAVDLTNLQRQIGHASDRLGQAKVDSLAESLRRLNPQTRVVALRERVHGDRLAHLVREADVILDCTDSFASRHAINSACVAAGRPLVSGAAVRFDAQLAVFDPRSPESPCYACLFPPDVAADDVRCATMGVFAPLVGVVGSLQAAEALKLLAPVGTSLAGRLLMLDARDMQWQTLRIGRQAGCTVCGSRT